MKKVTFLLCMSFIISPKLSWAQGAEMVPDSIQGDWAAFHHTIDGGITTDLCAAASMDTSIGMRVDSNSIQLRLVDKNWNLPSDTSGDVTITTGDYSLTMNFQAINPTMLATDISPNQLGEMIRAFDKSSSAKIKFGTKKTKTISLYGSTSVLSEFQGCVQQAGLADLGAIAGTKNSPF